MSFVFLDRRQVEALHDRALAAHGGLPGVRDENALASAVQRPQDAAHYRPDASVPDIAASFAYGIAKNHAFNDANKRTSLAATGVFLRMNGFRISATNMAIFETWIALAADAMSEAELSRWLASRLMQVGDVDPKAG